jgi:hypothetical protein
MTNKLDSLGTFVYPNYSSKLSSSRPNPSFDNQGCSGMLSPFFHSVWPFASPSITLDLSSRISPALCIGTNFGICRLSRVEAGDAPRKWSGFSRITEKSTLACSHQTKIDAPTTVGAEWCDKHFVHGLLWRRLRGFCSIMCNLTLPIQTSYKIECAHWFVSALISTKKQHTQISLLQVRIPRSILFARCFQ